MKIHMGRMGTGPQFDMTPDGQFIEPPREPASSRLLRYGLVVAVIAALAGVAALALWLALIMIPVAIVAAVIAYAAFRWRMWRMARSAGGRMPVRPPFGG